MFICILTYLPNNRDDKGQGESLSAESEASERSKGSIQGQADLKPIGLRLDVPRSSGPRKNKFLVSHGCVGHKQSKKVDWWAKHSPSGNVTHCLSQK